MTPQMSNDGSHQGRNQNLTKGGRLVKNEFTDLLHTFLAQLREYLRNALVPGLGGGGVGFGGIDRTAVVQSSNERS